MPNRFTFLLISILVMAARSSGQTGAIFQPLANDPGTDKIFLSELEKKYKKDFGELSGTNKKYIGELYSERYELIKEKFGERAIVTNGIAHNYLRELLLEIQRSNPSYKIGELRVHFSRAWWANASSMGEGTILFNIGLFTRLSNESQAAFVLCHELAHYFLNHSNSNIDRYVSTLYSEETQKELRRIQKEEYGKNSQLEKMARGLLFRSRKHSREFEQAADSMAIELMKNTRFDLSEALTCLALLDSADEEKYQQPNTLSTYFNFPLYPFKKSWLEEEESMGFAKEQEDKSEEDSLKTHPDCSKRIGLIAPLVKKYRQDSPIKFLTSEEKFTGFKNNFELEMINWCFETNKLSRALYYSLQQLSAKPGNPYLQVMIGKCLNGLYDAQKKHILSSATETSSEVHNKNYRELLRWIQNIRLKDIAAISYFFLETNKVSASAHPDFEQVYHTSKTNYANHK